MFFIKDLESFAAKAEQDLAKLWSKAPSFTDIALTTLTYVGPVLETVFTIEAGAPTGALVTAAITKAEQDLTAARGLINTIGPTLSVRSLVSGVATDLGSILPAANVTDAASVANLKLVIGELSALANSFPVPAAAAA
jgi:hypothetical protein